MADDWNMSIKEEKKGKRENGISFITSIFQFTIYLDHKMNKQKAKFMTKIKYVYLSPDNSNQYINGLRATMCTRSGAIYGF